MPRYFFHTVDGGRNNDDRGTVLPDYAAARVHAIIYAGHVMISEPDVLWDGQAFKVEVADDGGARLFTLVCYAIDEPASGEA